MRFKRLELAMYTIQEYLKIYIVPVNLENYRISDSVTLRGLWLTKFSFKQPSCTELVICLSNF